MQVVRDAGDDAQLALIRAHPELAGKAMQDATLTRESTHEQAGRASPTARRKNSRRFASSTPTTRRGSAFRSSSRCAGRAALGSSKAEIIATFERRLGNHADFELAEALRNIHRIAEIRLDDKFGYTPELGNLVWDWAERLAIHSDPGYAERGELTVTYLTDAHRACAQQLSRWMREDCGFDEVSIDAVGNVVGVYHGSDRSARRLLTGSHYDTVRNGGKYDGRLGILVPMACVRELLAAGRRLPFDLEVVGFAEEEGQRYKAMFLGSGRADRPFRPGWLDQQDADGVTMRDAMRTRACASTTSRSSSATRPGTSASSRCTSSRDRCSTSSTCRSASSPRSTAACAMSARSSAWRATPAPRRWTVGATPPPPWPSSRCTSRSAPRRAPNLVGTIGMLEVPNGSINVVPGRCKFSLDIRATTDAVRDACAADVLAELRASASAAACTSRSRKRCAPPPRPAQPAWQRALGARGRRRSGCRCIACRAAPATTR